MVFSYKMLTKGKIKPQPIIKPKAVSQCWSNKYAFFNKKMSDMELKSEYAF